MFFNYSLSNFDVYLTVDYGGHVGSNHFNGWLNITEPHTTRLGDSHIGDLTSIKLLDKGIQNCFGAGCYSASPHSNDNLGVFATNISSIKFCFLTVSKLP